jgi:hypothetical protein
VIEGLIINNDVHCSSLRMPHAELKHVAKFVNIVIGDCDAAGDI